MSNRTLNTLMATATLASLISVAALADTRTLKDTLKNVTEGSPVSLTGVVENANKDKFTLRDGSGTVNVDLRESASTTPTNGDMVTVNGKVHKGILSNTINAGNVEMNAAANALAPQASTIKNLPAKGSVQVTGTVESISDNPRKFTLKDQTGKVDVEVKSNDPLTVIKGSEVVVTGFVDEAALGLSKTLAATRVVMRSDTSATNNQ